LNQRFNQLPNERLGNVSWLTLYEYFENAFALFNTLHWRLVA